METKAKTKVEYHLLLPHAIVPEASCKEAGLTAQELIDLSDDIRFVFMGERGLSISEYIDVCKRISHLKLGYRKLMALRNEPKLSSLFPDEVYEVLKSKGMDKKIIYFDDSDDNFLRQNAQKRVEWLSKRFYCRKSTIYKRAKIKHIFIPRTQVAYTEKEDQFIREHISNGCAWIGRHLGRDGESIRSRAIRLGFNFNTDAHYYTPEENDYIKRNAKKGAQYLASKFGVNTKSIRRRAKALKIYLPYFRPNGTFVKEFNKKDDEFLIENADKGCAFVAKKLKRNISSVLRRARKINVHLKNIRHRYTQKENDMIRKHYYKGLNYLSKKIGVSGPAIKDRAYKLGFNIVEKIKEA